MTDNVESHTLALLREIREEMKEMRSETRQEIGEVRQELAEIRQQTAVIPQMAKDIAELQIGLAALSADLKIVKKDVEDVKETSSIIEGRLVRIEKAAWLCEGVSHAPVLSGAAGKPALLHQRLRRRLPSPEGTVRLVRLHLAP